jgi:hypothetical protein
MNNIPIVISKLESKNNTKMKRPPKQSKFIEQWKVAPIHPDYMFFNVGLMLCVDTMRSGETNNIQKHLLTA